MPTATALRLMQERNQWTCEMEGCERPGAEAHHCLYKKAKRYPELNCDENFQIVCKPHHETRMTDTYENRLYFWRVQCERYGREHMIAWHDALPLKVKEYSYR
jgi:hypothetical protein